MAASRRSRVLWRIAQAFVFSGILLFFKHELDQTNPGKILEEAVYTLLQTRLSNDKKLPVVVVDISALDAAGNKDGGARTQLEKVIYEIAVQRPRAIGIDIDFSPEEKTWTDRGGPPLFERLLDLQQQFRPLKIFVGVDRSKYGTSEDWLGLEKYRELAVMLALPAKGNRRMPLWIARGNTASCQIYINMLKLKVEDDTETIPDEGLSSCLPSMSAELAIQYGTKEDPSRVRTLLRQVGRRLEREKVKPEQQISTASYLVDYGQVQRLREQTVSVVDGKIVPAVDFAGKIVILGNTQWEATLDKYPIPPWQTEVAGVYFHASGTNTLIDGPLIELTEMESLSLDVLSAIAVAIVTLLLLEIKFLKKRTSEELVGWVVTWILVVGLAVLGYGVVRETRILWTDWLWICVALLIHGWMERRFDWACHRVTHALKNARAAGV